MPVLLQLHLLYLHILRFVDEVESLAAARKAALSGSEPSDSIRVCHCLFFWSLFPPLIILSDQKKEGKNMLL